MFNKRSDHIEPTGPAESHRDTRPLKVDPIPPLPAASRAGGPSVVGSSILIRGDMTGDEDLLVQGRVEGSITLKTNAVTIGNDGRVNATVEAKTITVEGNVEGELHGREQVIVTSTGGVQGNIVAPRVTLEDGCRFMGTINMEEAEPESSGKAAETGRAGKTAEKGRSGKTAAEKESSGKMEDIMLGPSGTPAASAPAGTSGKSGPSAESGAPVIKESAKIDLTRI